MACVFSNDTRRRPRQTASHRDLRGAPADGGGLEVVDVRCGWLLALQGDRGHGISKRRRLWTIVRHFARLDTPVQSWPLKGLLLRFFGSSIRISHLSLPGNIVLAMYYHADVHTQRERECGG